MVDDIIYMFLPRALSNLIWDLFDAILIWRHPLTLCVVTSKINVSLIKVGKGLVRTLKQRDVIEWYDENN